VFSPRYVITNKILGNLIELEKAALVVGLAPLQTDWEAKLKLECISRRAYSVLHFFGLFFGC